MTKDEIWHMHMAHITAALIQLDKKGSKLESEIVDQAADFVREIFWRAENPSKPYKPRVKEDEPLSWISF